MPTGSQDRDFAKAMGEKIDDLKIKMSESTLDSAIDWIANNLRPDDVFPSTDLAEWAERNGYKKEE